MAEREREVDPGQHGVGARSRAARRRGRSAPSPCRRPPSSSASARSSSAGHAGDPLDPLGPPRRPPTAVTSSKPVVRAATYSSSTAPSATSRCSRPRASARSVPGTGWRNEVGAVGGRRTPRVDHDDLPAALAQRVEVAGRRRHGLGQVGADQHQHVGLLEVGERERQPAVEPEGPVAGRRGRRHAPAAVVVDLAGAQRDPGELAELVGLLVGQPAAAEDRDRVGAVRRPAARRAGRRRGRAPRPRWPARSSPVARSRTSGVVSRSRCREQPGGGPALAAQARPRLTGNSSHGLDLRRPAPRQRHAALQRAVGAVGVGHVAISDARRRPGSARARPGTSGAGVDEPGDQPGRPT